jgi:hypothetical protein
MAPNIGCYDENMDRKNFIRTEENFTCEHCGFAAEGTGYTNHCPKCLYSKHVDNVPGDRANSCHGLMEPVGVETHGSDYDIVHRCQRCGIEKRNRVTPLDNREALAAILEQS